MQECDKDALRRTADPRPLVRATQIASLALAGALFATLLAAPAEASFDTDGDLAGDEVDTFPCDPTASAQAFAPAQGDHGMLMFEDQWPDQGDFDFNDVVLTYNYVFRLDRSGRAVSMRATYNVLALGGDFRSGLGLRLPIPAAWVARARRTVGGSTDPLIVSAIDAEATFDVSQDLRELFANPNQRIINADPNLPRQIGDVIEVEVEFVAPVPLPVASAPFDLHIFRSNNRAIQVHLPEYRGTANMDLTLFNTSDDGSDGARNFVDTRGVPFGLQLPTLAAHPAEGVAIDRLYPNILAFGQSGGLTNQDFYVANVIPGFAYRDAGNLPVPAPRFLSLDDLPGDTACVPAWGVAVQWGHRRSIFSYGGALAPNGDALITGYTQDSFPGMSSAGGLDAYLARYDVVTGAEIWVRQIGSVGDDTGRDVTTDHLGNIYVVGDVSTAGGSQDAFLAKFDANGTLQWQRTLGSPGVDSGYGVDVDALGNVFVAGFSSGRIAGAEDPGNHPSSFIAKFDPAGQRQWVRQYRTDPAHPRNYSFTMDLAVDPVADVVFVVGTERRFNLDGNAATNPYVAKHRASDGALLWVHHIGDHGYWNGSLDGRFGYGFGVDVDPFDGSAYVTGSFATGSSVDTWGSWTKIVGDDSPDAFFTKISPVGTEVWSHTLASDGHGQEYAEAVRATGCAGVVYFTGRTNGTLPGQMHRGGSDYYLVAYGYDGTRRWLAQGGTASSDMGHLAAQAVGSQQGGVVYTIGNTDTSTMSSSPSFYQTTFYRHDVVTGAAQGQTVARQIGWSAGAWSACSNTCGAGTMTRAVTCTYSDGTAVSDPSLCTRVPPGTTATCRGSSGCASDWTASTWSACSTTCGTGTRDRLVQCVSANGEARPDAECASVSPPDRSQACSDQSTCGYEWDARSWSACIAPSTCGLGEQSRTVFCRRSDGAPVADDLCSGSRPNPVRGCVDATCPTLNTSCAALLAQGVLKSGRYEIDPDGPGGNPSLNVYCDMASNGGGWTNLDFPQNRIWLDSTQYIACTGGLTFTSASITCTRPRFNGQESLPLYQLRCDGGDRSVDYVLDHVAPRLGHRDQLVAGFTTLTQGPASNGGASTGAEYCYAHGVVVPSTHLACAPYRYGATNGECVPGFFTLGL